MDGPFYAGHGFDWMQKFLNAVPRWYHKDIAFCIACAIHHLYVIKKSNKFKLNHKTLLEFCITRQRLTKYLQFFKAADLINYQIKSGSIPKIILLKIPNTNKQLTNNRQLTNIQKEAVTNHTGKLLRTEQEAVTNRTGLNYRKPKEPRKEGSKGRVEEKEVRGGRKGVRGGRKGREGMRFFNDI